MCYRAVECIDLVPAERSYVTGTYLPLDAARHLRHRTALTMPRSIDSERSPVWGQYALIRQPQAWEHPAWCDPTAPTWRGLPQAVLWNACGDPAAMS